MTQQETDNLTQDATPGRDGEAPKTPHDHASVDATPEPAAEIRIYVACLAAYNAGRLHGRWIDATLGEDHIWTETKAMLAASPEPGAEEAAIHDCEGFQGAPIEEYSSFKTVAAFAEFIAEHGALGGKLLEHFGGDLGDVRAAFEDYSGEHKCIADFIEDLTLEAGPAIPKQLEDYIDWEAMGRDMELSGDIFTIEMGFEEVHVFWSR